MRTVLLSVLGLVAGMPQASSPAPASAAAKVVVVPIHGEINTPNLALVRRAVREIADKKPALVIFEIDTPGGRVDHMLAMGEAITGLPMPTAAFIRPRESGESLG